MFKSFKLPVAVIVVGNISVGGTGKTPLVIWLVDKLKEAGWKPAVISRGYGVKPLLNPLAVNTQSDPTQVGDEPVLIARRTACPVWVGRDRAAVAQALLIAHPECNVIISDDGLQHYRLQRNFEIAVLDASRKFGNGWLLPAGPLRERVARLDSVDAVVSNGGSNDLDMSMQSGSTAQPQFWMGLESSRFNNLQDAERFADAPNFTGMQVHAVAGIGNPERFFSQLRAMQVDFEPHAFPDHHPYIADDLQSLHAEAILMTEKDAVKCAGFAQVNWWYLPVKAKVDEGLWQQIQSKIGSMPSAKNQVVK